MFNPVRSETSTCTVSVNVCVTVRSDIPKESSCRDIGSTLKKSVESVRPAASSANIFTVPGVIPSTRPSVETVATPVSDELQVTGSVILPSNEN